MHTLKAFVATIYLSSFFYTDKEERKTILSTSPLSNFQWILHYTCVVVRYVFMTTFQICFCKGLLSLQDYLKEEKTAQHHIHHQDVDGWIIFTGREIYHVKKLSKKIRPTHSLSTHKMILLTIAMMVCVSLTASTKSYRQNGWDYYLVKRRFLGVAIAKISFFANQVRD